MDQLIRSWIVEVLRQHQPLLSIAVRQRAKFEEWLKLELANYASHQGASNVRLESQFDDTHSRSDMAFVWHGRRGDVELKTCNPNGRVKGVEVLTRPIT